MKRIAVVFEFGTLNGGEHSILAVMDRLHDRKYAFVGIAPDEGRLTHALRQRGIPTVPLRLRDEDGKRLARDEVCRRLEKAVQGCSPDLVHANSLAMGRLTGSISDRLSVSKVAHLRDIITLSRQAVADLNRNDRLIAVSEATRRFHVDQGLDASKASVVYNGVDLERFQPRSACGWLKRELRLQDTAVLIGTIGQISLRKGQDVLAEAAVQAARQISNLHVVLIGERLSAKDESIRFERAVHERFAEAGCSSRLHCLGYREDVAQLMNELDLLVHPAKQEPLGRVLLEAAASGLPIVATAVGGTEEILTDGVSARLIPAGDAEALARAILEMVEAPAFRQRLATEARSQCCQRFDVETAAQNLAMVWENHL